MNLHRIVRGAAGIVILASLLLSYNNKWWLLLTALMGANLLQSAFTDTCPLMWVLRKMGIKESGPDKAKADNSQ
jgi:hypothetical protein